MKKRLHLYLVFLVVVSVCFLAVGYGIYIVKDIPSIKVLKNLENKPASSIFDANGQLIYLIVPDNRVFVQYSKIPKHVKMAFLAAEDADFFKHGAVEFQSLIRALLKNVIYGKVVQGGSTITQQVIKTLILGPERSLLRKAREAILAYKLESCLLYTSDAADDLLCVDLGGRRIIKKKKTTENKQHQREQKSRQDH